MSCWIDLDITKEYSMKEHVETMWLREKLYNIEKLNTCSLPFLLSAAEDILLLRQQENDKNNSIESIIMNLSDIIMEMDITRNAKELDESTKLDLYCKTVNCDRDLLGKNIELMQQISKTKEIVNIARNQLINMYNNSKCDVYCENVDNPSTVNLNNCDILTIINMIKDNMSTNANQLQSDRNKIDISMETNVILTENQQLGNIITQNEPSQNKLVDTLQTNEHDDHLVLEQINEENDCLKEKIANYEMQIKELKSESDRNLIEKLNIKEELEFVRTQFEKAEEENISNKKSIEDLLIKYENVEQLEQKVVALSEDLEIQIDEYFSLQTEVKKFTENEETNKNLLRELISKSSESFVEDKSVQELVQMIAVIICDLKALHNESDAISGNKIGSFDKVDHDSTLDNESPETQIENLRVELEKSKETTEFYITELREKNDKIDEMFMEIETISQQLQQSVDFQQSLNNAFETSKEKDEKLIEELKKEICNIEEKMRNLTKETENEIKIKLSLIESNEKTISELNEEINSLKEKNVNLINENLNDKDEFENRIKILELELEEEIVKTMSLKLKEKEVADLENEMKSCEVNYDNLLKSKNEIQSKLESLLEDYLKLFDELALIKTHKIELEKNFENYEIETKRSLADKSDLVTQLHSKIEDLENKIETIELEYKSEIKELEVKLKNSAETVETLSAEMENVIDINEKLATVNRELEIKIERNEIDLNELTAKARHLNVEMKEKEKDYLEQLREANEEIASQQTLVKDLTEENVNLVNKLNNSLGMIEEIKLNLNSLMEERDLLKMELDTKEDIVKEVSRKLEIITEEKISISNNLMNTEEKLIESKRDCESIVSQLVKLESNLEENKKNLMATLSEKKSVEEELKICQISLSDKENLIITLNNELGNSTMLIENLKTKLNVTTDEINQLNSLIETIRNSKELETLRNDLNIREEQLKKCEHQSLLYSNELISFKRENDMWTHKYNETHQEMQNAKKKFKKEISNLKNQHEMLELQLIDMKSRGNDGEIEKLKSTITDLNTKIESQKKQIAEFDSLHHHYNELKERYLEKRNVIKQQKDEIQTLNGKIHQMEREASRM